jgi:hypothetical protein
MMKARPLQHVLAVQKNCSIVSCASWGAVRAALPVASSAGCWRSINFGWPRGTGLSPAALARAAASAAVGREAGADSDDEDDGPLGDEDDFEEPSQLVFDTPAVVLAGFYVEELPGVRHMLDQAGGGDVVLIPCSPDLLPQPLNLVLQLPEPAWEQPVPDDWVDGGGWGRQRIALCAGLT